MRNALGIIACIIIMILSCTQVNIIYAAEGSKTVLESDFENDSFDGWFAFGNQCKLSIDSRLSYSGATSLHVSDRESTWSGPAYSTSQLFKPGETYHCEARVQAEGGGNNTIIWTVKYETPNGETYASISDQQGASGGWTFISGDILIPKEATGSCIYFEAEDIDKNFNIDLIKITGVSNATTEVSSSAVTEYHFDFEEGYDGWKQRGTPQVERTDKFSYTGHHSIYTTERTSTWHAPTVNISQYVQIGVPYEYSAHVMYNEKQYENNHTFFLELQYNFEGEEKYELVAEKELQKGNWSKISGIYTLPEGATDIYLYIQTADIEKGAELTENDLMNFYVDSVSIEDSTIKQKKERTQTIIIIALSVVITAFGIYIIIYIKNKLQETQSVLDSAAKDIMTGCFNRNSYEEQISYYEMHPDQCRNLFITICDVNFLKHINDNYGHEKGDNAIVRCATVLINSVGKKGHVYRTGGDEFVCITKSDMTQAINSGLETESQNYMGYPFAAAIGTASYNQAEDILPDIKKIIARSDKEMYKNKQVLKEKMKSFYGID